MIVDDERDLAEGFADILKEDLDGSLRIDIFEDFDEAERRLEEDSYDLVVLDVRLRIKGVEEDQDRGRRLHDAIAKVRWVPVVFLTALPEAVRDLEQPPLIRVVNKSDLSEAVQAVQEALASAIPSVTRLLGGIVDREVRGFLRDVVSKHWTEMAERDHEELMLVLVNRLAAWLKENAAAELASELQGRLGSSVDQASAAQVYLYPPVVQHLTCCDLLRESDSEYWLVLTPACDLVVQQAGPGQAERMPEISAVRLVRAHILRSAPPVVLYRDKKINKDKLKAALKGTKRYRLLPRYLSIPDLLVDFEQIRSAALDEVRSWSRIATLDSPFAEAMLTEFSHSAGRVGTPNVETQGILDAIVAES